MLIGGLIKVNDQFFLFITYIETLVRKTLTFSFMKTYEGEDICEVLHEKLEGSNMINKLWESLTRYIPNRHEVLSKWIDIRANAFVKTFVLIFKQKMSNMLNDKKKQQLRSAMP